jgi:hypothetical protein
MYMTVPSYSQDYLVSGVVPVVGGDGDPAAVHQASAQAASQRGPLGGTMANSRSSTHSRAWIVPRHVTTTSRRPRAAFPSSVVDPVAPCAVVEAGSHREGQYRANGGRIWVEGTAIAAPVETVVMQRRRRRCVQRRIAAAPLGPRRRRLPSHLGGGEVLCYGGWGKQTEGSRGEPRWFSLERRGRGMEQRAIAGFFS